MMGSTRSVHTKTLGNGRLSTQAYPRRQWTASGHHIYDHHIFIFQKHANVTYLVMGADGDLLEYSC